MIRQVDAASSTRSWPGRALEEDIANIRMIAQAMQKGSLCALGQTAPNPVLSALKHFSSEFTERLKKPVAAEA